MIRYLINRGRFMEIAGREYRVKELTLGQLAELEDLAYESMPSGFLALYLNPEDPEFQTHIKELRRRIRKWDVRLYPLTDLGMAHAARMAIGVPTVIEAQEILGKATLEEREHFFRLAYGYDDVKYLNELIYGEDEKSISHTPIDAVTQMVDWLCRNYGWQIDYVLSLTVNQISLCARSGKKQPLSRSQKSMSSLQQEWERRCSQYYGEDEDEFED